MIMSFETKRIEYSLVCELYVDATKYNRVQQRDGKGVRESLSPTVSLIS